VWLLQDGERTLLDEPELRQPLMAAGQSVSQSGGQADSGAHGAERLAPELFPADRE
jgi:hypothetical protein